MKTTFQLSDLSVFRPVDKGLWTLVVIVLSEIMEETQTSKCAALVYFGMAEEWSGWGKIPMS